MNEPKQIKPEKLGDYLDVMNKAGFQAGMSWKVVEAKWAGTQDAFRNFDPAIIAKFTDNELDALTNDTRVIRNRRKLEGVVKNARTMLALEKGYGSFQKYLRSHDGFEATVKNLRKRFSFMDEMGAYYFLYVVGEKVPPHEEWMKTREGK